MHAVARPRAVANVGGFYFPTNALGAVDLSWDPSPDNDIANYNLYEGPGASQFTNVIVEGNVTACVATNLVLGATYFFAVTAVDTNGLESDFSNVISYTVPAKPTAPGNLVFVKVQTASTAGGPWYDFGALPMLASATNGAQFYRLQISAGR